jgi:hypothetical protein
MLIRRAAAHLVEGWRRPPAESLSYLCGRISGFRNWLSKRLHGWWLGRSKTGADVAAIAWDQQDWTLELTASHFLRPYSGSIDVFLAEDADIAAMTMWECLIRGGVKFHRVNGLHLNMLRSEYAPSLAAALSGAIKERIEACDEKPAP